MTRHLKLSAARTEVSSAKERHVQLLRDVRQHCVIDNGARDGFRYLLAVPIIYAAWEGYFKLVCSLCLQRKCMVGKKAKAYPEIYSTLWLQKQGFVQTYLQKLFNAMQLGREASPKTGAQYKALANFTSGLSSWLDGPIDHAVRFDDLVMTYSNVDSEVLKLNADVLGLDLAGVRIGRLNELVGRRNEVAHGGLLTYPTETEVVGLLDFTDQLIETFSVSVERWLATS